MVKIWLTFQNFNVCVCEDGCLLMNIQNQLVEITQDGLVLASVGKRGE